MHINQENMEAQGYDVVIDERNGTVDIHPMHPVRIDWSPMRDQFKTIKATEREVEDCLDAFSIELEAKQLMNAIKNQ